MHLLITLLSLLIVTSVARASLTPTPSASLLKSQRFHGLWRIDRQESTIGDGGTTGDKTNSGVVAFTRKHLRIGRNVFEYEIMSWKEGMIEIQFWMDSGRLAEGVLFLADGVLSFHFLTGDEYHYFVMHRAKIV